MNLRWAWGLCIATAFCAQPLWGAEKVTLKLAIQPGQSWTFSQQRATRTDAKATSNGVVQPFTTTTNTTRSGKVEVLSARDGKPTAMRITFDGNCADSMEMGGQPKQERQFPLAGQTVTVKQEADGSVSNDHQGQGDPAALNEANGMLSMSEALYPPAPVAVGQEWQADPQAVAREMELPGPNDRAGMTLKLLSLKMVEGRRVAEVKVSTAITTEHNGIQTQMIAQGTSLIDVQTGRQNNIDLKGTLKLFGQQQGQGPNGEPVQYNIQGAGTMTMVGTTKLNGLDSVKGGNDNEPTPGNNSPSNPLTGGETNDGPANPLAGKSDPFLGRFSDGQLTLTLTATNGGYQGTVQLGEQTFPVTATATQNRLKGSFEASGSQFPFEATLDGTLNFVTGGKTYVLKKATPQPANPLAPSSEGPSADKASLAAAGDKEAASPSHYKVLKKNEVGQSLTATKAGVSTVQAALQAAIPDLKTLFDGKPSLGKAFEDFKDKAFGGVSFTATHNGQPVTGVLSCRLVEGGANISIVYARTTATPAQWQALTPADGATAPAVALQQYNFPDGTGSIGLAEGWTTNATTCQSGFTIRGPNDQRLSVGSTFSVNTPDSTVVQMQLQVEAQARQMGMAPPPRVPLLVAPYLDPARALAALVPQLSAMSQMKGGPSVSLESLSVVGKAKANLPNGQAALLKYTFLQTENGQTQRLAVLANVETAPVAQGAWMVYLTEAVAPPEALDAALPVMLQMLNSWKVNAEVMAQVTRNNIAAGQRRFEAGQRAHRALVASFDASNKAWEARQKSQDIAHANFIETIRGTRTVEDTSTGSRMDVPLGDSGAIVDKLNEYDPGRFKEIPLRDQ